MFIAVLNISPLFSPTPFLQDCWVWSMISKLVSFKPREWWTIQTWPILSKWLTTSSNLPKKLLLVSGCVSECGFVLLHIGAVKFGLLCELYSRNKKEMSKPEKLEVLEYVRARWVYTHWPHPQNHPLIEWWYLLIYYVNWSSRLWPNTLHSLSHSVLKQPPTLFQRYTHTFTAMYPPMHAHTQTQTSTYIYFHMLSAYIMNN